MIDLHDFDASKAGTVLDEFQTKLSLHDSDVLELLSMYCWCISNKVSIPEASNDDMLSRLKNHPSLESTGPSMDLPILRAMPDSRKQVLCSALLKPENSSACMASVAIFALLTSKLPNQLTFVHNFISQKGSPFVNSSNLEELARISGMLAKHGTLLDEERANCILKVVKLVKRVRKHESSRSSALEAMTILLRAISVSCLFAFTSDFHGILYDIEGVIKSPEFSEDHMKCVLEMLMACLSKQSAFWRLTCNSAFFHLASHFGDNMDSIISHIFEAFSKNDSFLEVEEDDELQVENGTNDVSDGESESVCSEDMAEIEKRIGAYIRMQKNMELVETRKKVMAQDMQFKLFDWLEILSSKIEHSTHAQIIMARHIVVNKNKQLHERFGKLVNEYYANFKKHTLNARMDPLEFQEITGSFFSTLGNPKHIFHFACDKILVFLLKKSVQIDQVCHDKILLHVRHLWTDFLSKRKPRNYIHIFTSILQSHTLAGAVMFSAALDKSSIRKLSTYEAQFLLTHSHRIIKQLPELHRKGCLELMTHASSSLTDLVSKGRRKRKLRSEIRKGIQLVSNFSGAPENVRVGEAS